MLQSWEVSLSIEVVSETLCGDVSKAFQRIKTPSPVTYDGLPGQWKVKAWKAGLEVTRSVGKQWSIFPRALEENGMRPATCPSELVMFSCHQTPAQPSEFRADDNAVLCDDGTHDTSRFWVSKSPQKIEISSPGAPTSAWMHWPQRDHSKRFGVCKAFLKCLSYLSWSTILDHQIQ